LSSEFLGDDERRRAPGKRIENQLAAIRAGADDPPQKLLGHLAAMKPGPLFERSRHAREVPGVFFRGKAVRHILRPENPRIIGQSSLRIGPTVRVHELAGRRDADRLVIEGELLRVLHEVE
jgi:hypothetical protein